MRSNQKNYKPFDYVFKKSRRRVETFFSQLCDQFMLKRNYAKSFTGLRARIIAKIAAFTLLQWFNKSNGKPINKLNSLCNPNAQRVTLILFDRINLF